VGLQEESTISVEALSGLAMQSLNMSFIASHNKFGILSTLGFPRRHSIPYLDVCLVIFEASTTITMLRMCHIKQFLWGQTPKTEQEARLLLKIDWFILSYCCSMVSIIGRLGIH